MSQPPPPATQSIGQILRNARMFSGLQTEDVAGEICIRRIFIEAMEAGDFEALPGGMVREAHLKCYADFLQLNSEDILHQFRAATRPAIRKTAAKAKTAAPKKSPHPSGLLVVGSTVLAFMLVVFWNLTHQRVVASPLVTIEIDAPPATIQTTTLPACQHPGQWPPCHWSTTGLWYRPINLHFVPQKLQKL